jgi:hypothetical protein
MEHLRYPNESTGYRAARNALLNDEIALRAQIEAVAHAMPETTGANVVFESEKTPRGGWQIKCHCPGGKTDYMTGFLDEQSIQNWLATDHRTHWLKVRGYQPSA